MTFLTKRHLPRRTFLRGLGVTMSLPLLDSMIPAQTPLARTAANPQIRLGLCFIPHGGVMTNWTPAEEGALKLSRTLAPLALLYATAQDVCHELLPVTYTEYGNPAVK